MHHTLRTNFSTTRMAGPSLSPACIAYSVPSTGQKVDGAGAMLGDLLGACLRATTAGRASVALKASTTSYVPRLDALVTRTLLLLRNLSLAPSTGQVRCFFFGVLTGFSQACEVLGIIVRNLRALAMKWPCKVRYSCCNHLVASHGECPRWDAL